MDDLDFGWKVVIPVMLLIGFVWYLISIVNYLFTILLEGQIKKVIDTTALRGKKNIFYAVLPFFISAVIISFIFFIILLMLYSMSKAMILEFYMCFLPEFIVGSTCLSLTRLSFTKSWEVAGRLKSKRVILNFFLWVAVNFLIGTTIALILYFYNLFILFLPFLFLLYSLLTAGTTYLFLRRRNIIPRDMEGITIPTHLAE